MRSWSYMTRAEKSVIFVTFVCFSAHFSLAVCHYIPPFGIGSLIEQGIVLAIFQLLEAFLNVPTILAQFKQSHLFSHAHSTLIEGKNREIKELKLQVKRAKEAYTAKDNNIITLQNHLKQNFQNLEREEARSNAYAKYYGDAKKKLERTEHRLHKAQQHIQDMESINFELSTELEGVRKKYALINEDAEEHHPTSIHSFDAESRIDEEEEDHDNLQLDIDRFLAKMVDEVNAELDLSAELRHKSDSGNFSSYSSESPVDSPGYHSHSSDKDDHSKEEEEESNFFAGFKSPLIRSQSESEPKSFAKIAAKPPAAFKLANIDNKMRKILPNQSTELGKTASSTNKNQVQQRSFSVSEKGVGQQKSTNSNEEPTDEEEKKKNLLYKTQFCLFWRAYNTGKSKQKCRNGSNCCFAHGESDLKKLDPHYFKTELCEFWNSDEPCPYGDSCNFAHGRDELRTAGVKGPKSVPKAPTFYNNRQRVRKPRIKTQTIQPLVSYGKPVEPKITVI